MASIRRITLASGLFIFGLGVSFLAIGGAGVATVAVVKGNYRGIRPLLFFIVTGAVALAIGSATVAYSFRRETPTPDGSTHEEESRPR